MADDPYANSDPYAPPTAYNPTPVTDTVRALGSADPQAVTGLLNERRAAFQKSEVERKQAEGKQQLNVDEMSKLLDETAATIKKSREGRTNLPMMAMGAAMMGSPGNFGQQLGAGIQAMVPQIQKGRDEEDQTALELAKLGLKKGEIANMPLHDKLAYIKAMQLGDVNAMRALEVAQVRAQGNVQDQTRKDREQERKDVEQARKEQKLKLDTINAATQAAEKEFEDAKKEAYFTPEEAQQRRKEILQRHLQTRAGGAGISLNQEEIDRIVNGQAPTTLGESRSYFPKPEEMAKAGEQAGLPAPPKTYEGRGVKDRTDIAKAQAATYQKESAKWDEEALADKTNDDLLKRAQQLIQANPDLMGVIKGKGWNVTPEAQQLDQILKRLETTTIPKGQGAITDFERGLFKDAGVKMTQDPQAAVNIINQMRAANQRSVDQRAFLDKYYQTYRTMEGAKAAWEEYMRHPNASTVVEDPQTKRLVNNPNHMSSDVYFKWNRMGKPKIGKGEDGAWYIDRGNGPEKL